MGFGKERKRLITSTLLPVVVAISAVFGLASAAQAQTIDNTATVTGSSPQAVLNSLPPDVTATDTESVPLAAPDREFTIAKTVQAGSPTTTGTVNGSPATVAGDTITYEYVFTNTGNQSIDGSTVSITDPGPTFSDGVNPAVPSSNALGTLTLVAATDVGGDGIISPGEAWTYEAIQVLTQSDINTAGDVTNGVSNTITAATANTVGGDPATLDGPGSTLTAETTIDAQPFATVAKSDATVAPPSAPYAPGDVITYEFLVTNSGNVTLSGLTVTDTIDVGTGTMSPIVCPTSSDETIATLAPGASETCTATYTVLEADL